MDHMEKNVIQLLKLSNLIIFTPSEHKKEHEIKLHKPIWPVLDVSLLGLYLLSFNDFLVRRPVKSWSRWGAVWIFFVRMGNISLSDAWPSAQRQPTTFQPIRTDIRLVPH